LLHTSIIAYNSLYNKRKEWRIPPRVEPVVSCTNMDMTPEKRKGLLKLRLVGIMEPFMLYGMDVYVALAIKQIVIAVEELYGEVKGEQWD